MKLFFRIAGLFLLLTAVLADDLGFDLSDALDNDDKPTVTVAPPKKDSGGGLDLADAFGDDEPTNPPVVKPPSSGGGGGTIKDSDLFDVSGGSYEPDGGRAADPGYDTNDGAGGHQPESGQNAVSIGSIAGVIGTALLGMASTYIAKKKNALCFSGQGGQNQQNYHQGYKSEPQAMSDLMEKV